MSSERQIGLLLGSGGGFFAAALNPTPETTKEFLSFLPSYGITHLDTAAVYPGGSTAAQAGRSEKLLGQTKAAEKFVIDTKIMVYGGHDSDGGGELSREKILESFQTSLERLGVEKVHVLYCHRPDPSTPLEETAATFDELCKQGKIEKWGISNYKAETLKELFAVCEKKGYTKPAVYQGMYNVLCRHADTKLFPILKENGIVYNCYSPTAGGLFATKPSSRYTPGVPAAAMWTKMYKENPKMLNAIDAINESAEKNGLTALEASLRWVVHHAPLRPGDGVILGARNREQLEENVSAIKKGPLPEELVKCMDDVWETVKDVAPGDV